MILVDAAAVTVTRPDRPLFRDLSVTVSSRDRLGVVGINGTGKSTLLRVLAGAQSPEAGVVRFGRGVRVSVLDQEAALPGVTVADAVGRGWEVASVLERLGMGGRLDTPLARLSGGQSKRVALARALVTESDLLVLDEPTNHLDLDAIEWLEERIARSRSAVVLVSHDRHLLDRVCTRMLELDRGAGYVHEGGYQAFLDGRDAREDRAVAAEETRRNLARRELAWLRRGAPARTSKSKARIDAATELIERQAQAPARAGTLGFDAALARRGEGQARASTGAYRSSTDERSAPRLGTKVVELHDVSFAYPGAPEVLHELTWLLAPGGRYGIVGPNGAGKSTLLEVLAGRLVPTAGRVDTGPTVRIGYYDQRGRTLDPSQRVRDAVAGPTRAAGAHEDARLMEQFWFDGDAQWAEIGTLSGGERRRLQLLLTLVERPNVLLLDEPTNDLDLDTLRSLEELLDEWPGTLVVVSHDRTFLDRTVEEVFALDGHGGAAPVPGGYAGWIAARAERSSQPGRSTGAGTTRTTGGSGSGGSVVPVPASAPAGGADDGGDGAATVAPVRRRSPSTLRRLLFETDKELAKLAAKQERLATEMTAAGSDYTRLAALGEQLSEVDAAIAAAEERWLELSTELEG